MVCGRWSTGIGNDLDFSSIWKFSETDIKRNFPWELSHGLSLAVSLTSSSSWPVQKKGFSHRTSQAGQGAPSPSWYAVSLARASFIGFGGGTGETQSEESVIRFKGSGFVWSLCYLTALKLYNAKQVPFFFIYGSYIYPLYYCHTFFQPDSW